MLVASGSIGRIRKEWNPWTIESEYVGSPLDGLIHTHNISVVVIVFEVQSSKYFWIWSDYLLSKVAFLEISDQFPPKIDQWKPKKTWLLSIQRRT